MSICYVSVVRIFFAYVTRITKLWSTMMVLFVGWKMPKQARYSRVKSSVHHGMHGIYDNKTGKTVVDGLSKRDVDKLVKDWNANNWDSWNTDASQDKQA